MPNITTNTIKMEGICHLPLFDDKGNFDFNKIIPMPPSLDVECGSITDQAIVCYLTEKGTIPVDDLDYKKVGLLVKSLKSYFKNSLDMAKEIFIEINKISSAGQKNYLYEKGKIYVDNYLRYGATTWYDWCCQNWGTQWNAGNTDFSGNDMVTFQTAWSTPEPVIKKLSEMYPDIRIEVTAYDEDPSCPPEHYSYIAGNKIS